MATRRLLFVLSVVVAPVASHRAIVKFEPVRPTESPIENEGAMIQATRINLQAVMEKEKQLQEQVTRYCQSGGGEGASIWGSRTEIPSLVAYIREIEEQEADVQARLRQLQGDRGTAAAAATISKSTTLVRKKGTAAFAGSGLPSFLSRNWGSVSVPKPGVEKQLGFADAASKSEEEDAIKRWKALKVAKQTDATATDKIRQTEALASEFVSIKKELNDGQKALLEDQRFIAEMEYNCTRPASKDAEWYKWLSDGLVKWGNTVKAMMISFFFAIEPSMV